MQAAKKSKKSAKADPDEAGALSAALVARLPRAALELLVLSGMKEKHIALSTIQGLLPEAHREKRVHVTSVEAGEERTGTGLFDAITWDLLQV